MEVLRITMWYIVDFLSICTAYRRMGLNLCDKKWSVPLFWETWIVYYYKRLWTKLRVCVTTMEDGGTYDLEEVRYYNLKK